MDGESLRMATGARQKKERRRAEADSAGAGLLERGIVFETLKEFQLGKHWAEKGGSFLSVLISTDHDMFITAQRLGRVTLFNLAGDQLCWLNQ